MKATGAHVYATARNLAKGERALGDSLEPGKLELMLLDLNSLASVRSFAETFLKNTGGKLNILINNAGVMATPEGKTEDGFETQFGTNHLAHFLLFQLLKQALLSSSTPAFNSRVVVLSSMTHRYYEINFDNIMLTGGEYDPQHAYAHSKIANIYMANAIERRYGSQGLHANSLHPGGIMEGSGLQVNIDESIMKAWMENPKITNYLKDTKQGAATTVWAAVAKCWEGRGGQYLEDCQVGPPCKKRFSFLDMGYEKWAFNRENEDRLWRMSNEYVGLKADE